MHAYVAVPGMAWDEGDEVGLGWGDQVEVRGLAWAEPEARPLTSTCVLNQTVGNQTIKLAILKGKQSVNRVVHDSLTHN